MRLFPKSNKLEHVCYDIRGPVHKEALRLEEEGYDYDAIQKIVNKKLSE